MSDESTFTLDNLPEFLLDLAGPALFRANAFRIIGLPAHVAETEIRKQGDKLRFMLRHGGSLGGRAVGPLPLDPTPLDETVSDALHRLSDPETRFIDEFFWFWPQSGLGSKDPAFVALSNRDVETAIEIWTGEARRDDDHGRSSHNLAVMFHTLALDIEYARETETISKKLETVQYTYWHKGLSQWQAVLADEEFWNQLDLRVFELNDPRLTIASARQMRTVLPLVLLLINAQIVARASTSGASAEGLKYRSLIEESGFAEELVEEALGRSTQLIRNVISTNCRTAEQEAYAAPATADKSARLLLQQTQPLLAAIDMLLPSVATGDEARDEVATAATNCLYLLSDETAKSEVARELLEMTRPYAVSLAVRERLDYLRAAFLRSAYRDGHS
jgi:hypothetical protein